MSCSVLSASGGSSDCWIQGTESTDWFGGRELVLTDHRAHLVDAGTQLLGGGGPVEPVGHEGAEVGVLEGGFAAHPAHSVTPASCAEISPTKPNEPDKGVGAPP